MFLREVAAAVDPPDKGGGTGASASVGDVGSKPTDDDIGQAGALSPRVVKRFINGVAAARAATVHTTAPFTPFVAVTLGKDPSLGAALDAFVQKHEVVMVHEARLQVAGGMNAQIVVRIAMLRRIAKLRETWTGTGEPRVARASARRRREVTRCARRQGAGCQAQQLPKVCVPAAARSA